MFYNSIQLTKAANGFIVVLPIEDQLYSAPPDYTDPETIKKMAAIMRDEMHKDPLIEQLMSDAGAKEVGPSIAVPKKTQNNIFVFKTFNEVADFLRTEFHK